MNSSIYQGILTPNLFVLTLPDAPRDPFVERSRETFSNLALMLPPVSPLTLIGFRPSFFPVFVLPPTRITLVVPPLVTRRARLPPADDAPSMAMGMALPFLTPPLTDTGVFLLMATPFWPLGVEPATFFPALGLDFGAGFTPLDGVFFFWDGDGRGRASECGSGGGQEVYRSTVTQHTHLGSARGLLCHCLL